MPPKATAAPSWNGAPPVSKDGFSFVNRDFFVEASGENRHRRATIAEIKEHFTSGNDRDYPAHWFEAQLVHYGLKPSKSKAVARMRLLDATMTGDLTVPANITKLETELKKQWTKNDRDAKKNVKGANSADVKVAGVKRKAGGNVSVTVNLAVSGSDSPKPPTKKAKVTASKATASKATPTKTKAAITKAKATASKATTSKATTPKRKATAKATPDTAKAKAKPAAKSAKTTTPKAPKLSPGTARRGGSSAARGPSRSTPNNPSAAPSPQKQTARRGGAFMARGRVPVPEPSPTYDDYHGGYVELDDGHDGYDSYNDGGHDGYRGCSDSYESPPPYSEW
ncbi:hypothetical protein B0J13DRAFT_619190 [Dactylonectria estremocensis]|uniref:Uncharacterized protein n=1 Tax=Dactylonectria estremocensis TaxID=1079267 RepID=A0A9P9JD86_9HYPO|nr:hypothetical protein B0J13DRAFT_619190 [Dactylonectria estremocensis]